MPFPPRACSLRDARLAHEVAALAVAPDMTVNRKMEMGTEMETELVVWQDDAHESLSAIQAVCRSILSALR